MIGFYDFVPQVLEKGVLLKAPVLEQLTEPLQRANAWITEHNVNVINIETVVLPNIHSKLEEGSTDTHLSAGEYSRWHQFIRVWYQYEPVTDT